MIMQKNQAVFGIFKNRTDTEHAVDSLKFADFRSSDISVLMPDRNSTQAFAHTKETKAPEGTAAGAASGAVLGGGLGWLIGIGALAIPGMGPFIAAGPIVTSLAGMGVGGALGGVAGALVGMGIPEYEAKRFEGIVKEGGILLSVHADDPEWVSKAKFILEETGATDIAASDEVSSSKNARNNSDHMKDVNL
jgi:hypothetical protein